MYLLVAPFLMVVEEFRQKSWNKDIIGLSLFKNTTPLQLAIGPCNSLL